MKRKIVKKRPLIINVLKKIGLFFALFGLLIISVSVLVFLIAGIIFGINQLLDEAP